MNVMTAPDVWSDQGRALTVEDMENMPDDEFRYELDDGVPLMGRVMSVFNPLQQVANITSIAVAGLLAGTVLRGMHQVVAGVKFGPVDTIFAASAVFIIIGGLVMISPLSDTARS